MILPTYVQKLIREQMGCELTRPSHFDALALAIEEKTHEHIGTNTLKRLFGLLPDVEPTITTLDVIAQYLNFSNWSIMERDIDGKNSAMNADTNTYPGCMPEGTVIKITYEPRRFLIIKTNDAHSCIVMETNSKKLQPDDVLFIPYIAKGQALVAKYVIRQEKSIGSYVGGCEGGVTSVAVVLKP